MPLAAAPALRECWQAKAASLRHLTWRWGPRCFFSQPPPSVLSGPCFPPRGRRNQRKSKTWDRWENPAVGRTHFVLATLLYPLEPVLPDLVSMLPCPKGGWRFRMECRLSWLGMLPRWFLPVLPSESITWLPLTDRGGH